MNLEQFPSVDDQPGIERLYFHFAIGASGVIGTVTRNRGTTTPVKNATGDYSIPLESGVQAIVGFHAKVIVAAPAITDAHIIRPKTLTAGPTSPLVRFETWTQGVPSTSTDGAVANPPSGAVIQGWIAVKNTQDS